MKIAVVGAGVAGLVSALTLARAGHAVTVLERERLGAGASGLALGVLVPSGLQRKIDVLQRRGIVLWPDILRQHGDVLRDWGDGCLQLRLPMVLEVLRDGIEALGGKIVTGIDVMGVADARLQEFDGVVLAAGLGNTALGGLPLKVSVGQALRLRPPALFHKLVRGEKIFICPDWDGHVLVGSENWTMEHGTRSAEIEVRPEATALMMEKVARLAPELAGAEIVQVWTGARPVSDPRLPLVRPVAERVWAVAGLGKIGFCLAPCVGEAVVEAFRA